VLWAAIDSLLGLQFPFHVFIGLLLPFPRK